MAFNIIVDIHGVITNDNLFTNLDYLRTKTDKKTIFTKVLGSMPENIIAKKILLQGISFYTRGAKIRNQASTTIDQFRIEGDRVILMTRVPFANDETTIEGQKIRAKNELNLLENNINYDDIIYVNGNKIAACKATKADVIIDDNPNNIYALSNAGFKVICFRTDYNQIVENDETKEIYIAHNWDEVYSLVQELKRQKKKKGNNILKYTL